MAEAELFSFNTGGKKPSLRQLAGDKPSNKAAPREPVVSSDSEGASSGSYYSEDEEGVARRRRRRKRRSHHRPSVGDDNSIASRLMHNKPITVVLDDSDDDITITSPSKKTKLDRDGSSSPSLSLSPCPSPPPVIEPSASLADKKSRMTLDKANNVLNMLRWSRPSDASFSDSYSDTSYLVETPPTTTSDRRTMTLRVRCKGKVHKFDVCKGDPLSGVCSELAGKVGADEGGQLLLSHKNSTIRQTESPASLGLTTADIIDAVVMAESSVASTAPSCVGDGSSRGPSINIKVQSSEKSIVYSLSKTDPLQKAMTAFASALGVSITKLKFTFDGDQIKPTQTSEELEMEDNDCIDARVIA